MLEIKGTLCFNFEEALEYYESSINYITNMMLQNHSSKEDCRQELRIKIWSLFKNQERVFNSAYINQRLRFDTVNFMTRDHGYLWNKWFSSLDNYTELELNDLMCSVSEGTGFENIERDIELEDLIVKASKRLTEKQYEALILFLSGAPTPIIRKFLKTRSRNITRYYLLLAESFTVLKEIADETCKN